MKPITPALVTLLALAIATPARAFSDIPDGPYNLWLVEHPVPTAPLYRARIAGVASYQRYQGGATIAFSCRRDTPGVIVELAFNPTPLDFDADPYEGPDATAHGPIIITSGHAPASSQRVSGRYGDGGPFDTGTPFIFGFSPSVAQVQSWTAARGQSLRVEVPAPAGGTPLTMQFRWPDDNAAFVRVVSPCLGKPADSH
jgi:hypothetical protein